MALDTRVIETLVHAAVDAMEREGEEASPAEILSAAFTVAMRTSQVILSVHPEHRQTVLQAAQILLLQCADQKRPN